MSSATPSSGSVLGIDIGSSALKVVQLKKKGGRAILETYGELSLGPYGGVEIGRATNLQAGKLAEALGDLLKESKTSTKTAALSIPVSASLITFITMPAVGEKQLAQMIPIEARKYIPVPISEVSLDWLTVPQEDRIISEDEDASMPGYSQTAKGERVEVLLVVIHNEAIARNKEIVSNLSLSATFSEIETFSTIRASLDQGIAPVLICDLGAASTKLYIVERGLLRNSHTINRGAQDITIAISKSLGISMDEAENLKREYGLLHTGNSRNIGEATRLTLDYIFAEVGRVILNFQKRHNKNIGRIVLSGGGALLKGLREVASANFQTEVELANPFGKVEAPAFLNDVLRTAGPEFATAIGLAIRKLQELG
ncbi:MAG: type IV pilus assembly protein PilM [Candidatus Paceibacterota bacterium]